MKDGNNNRVFTVKSWVESHQWPPVGGLRHLIFNAKQNGFDAVIRRVGRRVLIDEAAFYKWVEQQQSVVTCKHGGRHA